MVEGYPGGAQDILGLPRKKAGVGLLQKALREEGLGGDLDRRPLTHDELDAVTIAWVGWSFRHGHGVLIGDPTEGLMLLPEAERTTGPKRLPPKVRSAERAGNPARRGDS